MIPGFQVKYRNDVFLMRCSDNVPRVLTFIMSEWQNVKDDIDEMYYNYLLKKTHFFRVYPSNIITLITILSITIKSSCRSHSSLF